MAESFFDRVHKQDTHTPDVLSCLANLSNDEVFTPPEVVNQMLDMLPQELFASTETTFLDPACKTGVFLREIAKRLLSFQLPFYQDKMQVINDKRANGFALTVDDEIFLEKLQKAIDHIFHKQLFGIAITELTSLLSRRSLYCSKYPNGPYSITHFDDAEGNIRYRRLKHTWDKSGKCVFCGTSAKGELGENKRGEQLETHAYEWIHTLKPEEIFNMKFDVIIGNPPYHLSTGSNLSSAIYHNFISQAIKLNPSYITMITPSKWMTKSTQGIPDKWVDEMLYSNNIAIMHDFEDAKDCFSGVEIKGGVSYFLWKKDYKGKCEYNFHKSSNKEIIKRVDYLDAKNAGIVIRNPLAYPIIDKIEAVEGKYSKDETLNFSNLVSGNHFYDKGDLLTTNWNGYSNIKTEEFNIKYHVLVNHKRTVKWIKLSQIPKNAETRNMYRVYIPSVGGSGTDQIILGKPILGEPNSLCSQTFLVIGWDTEKHNFSKEECENIISYIQTKFFRFLVSIVKKTHHASKQVYRFVPMQDFSKPWTDEELYKKYNLTQEEIDYIESMIRPLDLDGGEIDG